MRVTFLVPLNLVNMSVGGDCVEHVLGGAENVNQLPLLFFFVVAIIL